MTEEEWRAVTDPSSLLRSMRHGVSDRKLRLFTVACCRRVWEYLPGPGSRKAVEAAERYADGAATPDELDAACSAAEPHESPGHGTIHVARLTGRREADADYRILNAFYCSMNVVLLFTESTVLGAQDDSHFRTRWDAAIEGESLAQANLLRDVFGNPFRPITFDPAWRTSDVMLLANGIYAEKAFDRMPILADALQDAGCDRDELLSHLRNPHATHVRGCWALDLVLGKE